MKRTARGTTLVEIMVVAGCLVLLIGPILAVMRSGARVSRKGLIQIDTTLEARRVIQQVHQDLKNACLDTSAPQADTRDIALGDFCDEKGTAPMFEFSFYSFPLQGGIQEMVKSTGPTTPSPRLASRITYRLEKIPGDSPGKPSLLALVREEKLNPAHPDAGALPDGKRTHILTKRLNYFRIQPHEILTQDNKSDPQKTRGYFWVTLQLRDLLPETDPTELQNPDSVLARTKGIVIADFYDVVYPEYFNAYSRQPRAVRNWHSVIQGP